MTRPPKYLPRNCPWAALVDRGLIRDNKASAYRRGHAVPGPDRIAYWGTLGYHITIDPPSPTHPKGRAVCAVWPEKEA